MFRHWPCVAQGLYLYFWLYSYHCPRTRHNMIHFMNINMPVTISAQSLHCPTIPALTLAKAILAQASKLLIKVWALQRYYVT